MTSSIKIRLVVTYGLLAACIAYGYWLLSLDGAPYSAFLVMTILMGALIEGGRQRAR
jgi:hypothetical protein